MMHAFLWADLIFLLLVLLVLFIDMRQDKWESDNVAAFFVFSFFAIAIAGAIAVGIIRVAAWYAIATCAVHP